MKPDDLALNLWLRKADHDFVTAVAEALDLDLLHERVRCTAADLKTRQKLAESLEQQRQDAQRVPIRITGRSPSVHASRTGLAQPGTYELPDPAPTNDNRLGQVTPRLQPATLDVAAPGHGHVQVAGLARWFPAHTVHARRSTAVVAADNCELQSTDHYHIHRVSVSLDGLLESGTAGNVALRALLQNQSAGGIARFQESMRALATSAQHRETQASVPVRADHQASVTGAKVVQLGENSTMTVNNRYVIEQAELPIFDLLARDPSLVRSLIEAAGETRPGAATRRFLRNALSSAGRADDLDLLEHSTIPRAPGTSILGLFGVDVVDQASAVMVGSGNQLTATVKVARGRLTRGTILDDLATVSGQAAELRQTPASRPDPTAPSGLQVRALPRYAADALRLADAPPDLPSRSTRPDPGSPPSPSRLSPS